jgi:hypothetical protein
VGLDRWRRARRGARPGDGRPDRAPAASRRGGADGKLSHDAQPWIHAVKLSGEERSEPRRGRHWCGPSSCPARRWSVPTRRTRSPPPLREGFINEVKQLGSLASTTCTVDQTEAAIFLQGQGRRSGTASSEPSRHVTGWTSPVTPACSWSRTWPRPTARLAAGTASTTGASGGLPRRPAAADRTARGARAADRVVPRRHAPATHPSREVGRRRPARDPQRRVVHVAAGRYGAGNDAHA